jgi:DNA-binding transcriptional ArsR family regulator
MCTRSAEPLASDAISWSTYNHMVVDTMDDQEIDRLFHALADATRRDIVVRSMRGDHSVSALARRYPMSVTAIQKHVSVLEDAGLVRKERRGREQIVRCNIETVRTARALLDEIDGLWRGRIDRLSDLLAEPEGARPR